MYEIIFINENLLIMKISRITVHGFNRFETCPSDLNKRGGLSIGSITVQVNK